MPKGNAYINDLLAYLLQGIAIPEITGTLYLALHTASPGAAGDQTTNEATYTGYSRVSIVSSSGNWTVASQAGSNVNSISFPQCTGGSNTITYFSIGFLSSGAGKILVYGALGASLAVSNLITPQFAPGAITYTES